MTAPKAVQMRIACGSPAAARTGVQRRPCGAVAPFAGRREGSENRRSHPLRQHSDDLRAEHGGHAESRRRDLAEETRAPRARRQKQAHRHDHSQAGPGKPSGNQGRIERQPMRMAAESGDVGDRRQQQRDRCDGPNRNRQSAGGKQSVSIDGRGEDQLKVRAPKQRAGEIRDRLAHDPWQHERGAAGENRRNPRRAVGPVFNADEPAGDRVGRDVERHEHERDQNRQSAAATTSRTSTLSARALRRKSCRTKRGKAAQSESGAESCGAPGLRGQIEEHRLQCRPARANAGAQLIERPLGDHLAARNDADSVRKPLSDLENMRGHDDRRAGPHAIRSEYPSPAGRRRRRGRSAARRASGAAAHG